MSTNTRSHAALARRQVKRLERLHTLALIEDLMRTRIANRTPEDTVRMQQKIRIAFNTDGN